MNVKNVENVLQVINRDYVSLDESVVTKNTCLVEKTLDRILPLMKTDHLFKALFQKTFYGGSFYDGLKIEKPNEFDLDFLLVLPKKCEFHKVSCDCLEMIPSNIPGSFWFKVKDTFYGPLKKFIKDDYIQTDLVINWLQCLVDKALNLLNKNCIDAGGRPAGSLVSRSGPALVLRITGEFGHISVDLVPAFKFGPKYWPKEGFISNPTNEEDFWIVPKKANVNKGERHWRASFQAQERELLTGKEKLKPALRLLKKMRNNLQHMSICSYALKTIVLWNLETWNQNSTLTEVFLGLLKEYQDHLNRKELPYFWNKKQNLLGEINSVTLENHGNEISRKINIFEKNMRSNPLEIAKIILKEGSEEYKRFIEEYGEPHRTQGYSNERETGMIREDQTSTGDVVALCIAGLAIAAVVGITTWHASRPRNNNR